MARSPRFAALCKFHMDVPNYPIHSNLGGLKLQRHYPALVANRALCHDGIPASVMSNHLPCHVMRRVAGKVDYKTN
jgi:hypothetical protein